MTPIDYRKAYSEQLKTFLATPAGQHFFATFSALRPGYEFPPQGHLLDENRGAIRGYDQAIRNILSLAVPYTVQAEPEPNYGVPSKAQV